MSSDLSASKHVRKKKIQLWKCHFYLAWFVLSPPVFFLSSSVFLSPPPRCGLSEWSYFSVFEYFSWMWGTEANVYLRRKKKKEKNKPLTRTLLESLGSKCLEYIKYGDCQWNQKCWCCLGISSFVHGGINLSGGSMCSLRTNIAPLSLHSLLL